MVVIAIGDLHFPSSISVTSNSFSASHRLDTTDHYPIQLALIEVNILRLTSPTVVIGIVAGDSTYHGGVLVHFWPTGGGRALLATTPVTTALLFPINLNRRRSLAPHHWSFLATNTASLFGGCRACLPASMSVRLRHVRPACVHVCQTVCSTGPDPSS